MVVWNMLPLIFMVIAVFAIWIVLFYFGPRFTSRTISKIKKLSVDDSEFVKKFFEFKSHISDSSEQIIAERNCLYKALWLDCFSENLFPDTKFHELVILCESDSDLITRKNREHAYQFLINLKLHLEKINNNDFSISSSMTIADIIEVLLVLKKA